MDVSTAKTTRMGRLRIAGASLAMLVLVTGLAACEGGSTGLPGAQCPQPSPAPEYGPRAERAAETSINLELSQAYMRHKVRSSVETDVSADSGVRAGVVRLSEKKVGEETVNLVSVTITPWLQGANGPVELPRSYDLRLELVPYLVTPDTVPDEQKRRAILLGPDRGALLAFSFHELFSRVNQEVVTCSSSNFDLIDSQVLGGVYESLRSTAPLVLPADAITGVAASLSGKGAELTGINLGSDLELKIGFRLSTGTPDAFEPVASLSHFPNEDWGLTIDTEFVTSAIRKAADDQAAAVHPAAVVDDVFVDYTSQGLDVTVKGTVHICSNIHFTSKTHVTPQVRLLPDGSSVLRAPADPPVTTDDRNTWDKVCGPFDVMGRLLGDLFTSFTKPFGSATLVVQSGCRDIMGPPVEFDAGLDDRFYASAVDTDGVFYIAGRSTMVDRAVGARPPVPSC